ncbi:MarR family winged helix-turn-helix transcriptional regulator [Paenibacillus sp. FJAT-26967]|uniref:MarR family winged helix-turn-helix transcriptional regulator n=1 Tax=Paenibacillus sp. FJAT-26967 TaxID=1729690 RepID=UPI00083908B6|nr:MarR family transcriptional regulator [Paenibacillus sp. FJAT-26967]
MISQMRKLSTRIVLFHQNAASSIGVIHTDLKTADILNETGPITAGELSKITGLTTGTVTALLDRLEDVGFITRQKDPRDGRRVIIVPNLVRQKSYHTLYEPLSQHTQKLCSSYTQEELEVIHSFLTQMTGVFELANEQIGSYSRDPE